MLPAVKRITVIREAEKVVFELKAVIVLLTAGSGMQLK